MAKPGAVASVKVMVVILPALAFVWMASNAETMANPVSAITTELT